MESPWKEGQGRTANKPLDFQTQGAGPAGPSQGSVIRERGAFLSLTPTDRVVKEDDLVEEGRNSKEREEWSWHKETNSGDSSCLVETGLRLGDPSSSCGPTVYDRQDFCCEEGSIICLLEGLCILMKEIPSSP